MTLTSPVYEYNTLLSRSNASVIMENGSSIQNLTVQGGLVMTKACFNYFIQLVEIAGSMIQLFILSN